MVRQKISPFVAIATKDYSADDKNKLDLMKGEFYLITQKDTSGWWYGESVLQMKGWLPGAYVREADEYEANSVRDRFSKRSRRRNKKGESSRASSRSSRAPNSLSSSVGHPSRTPERRSQRSSANSAYSTTTSITRGSLDPRMKQRTYEEGMKEALSLASDNEVNRLMGHKPRRSRRGTSQEGSMSTRAQMRTSPQSKVPHDFNFEGKSLLDFIFDEVDPEEGEPGEARWDLVCAAVERIVDPMGKDVNLCTEFLDCGGFDAILSVIDGHTFDDKNTEISCLLCLRHMSVLEDLSTWSGEINPFPVLLGVVENYKGDGEMLQLLFSIMNNIVSIPHNRKLLSRDPTIAQVMETFLEFVTHEKREVRNNTVSILASIARDQQHLFNDGNIRTLLEVGSLDDINTLRNILATFLNLSELEITIPSMVKVGLFEWLTTLIETNDKKILEMVQRLIKNVFVNCPPNLEPHQICILFLKLIEKKSLWSLCIGCMTLYTKKCHDKLRYLNELINSRVLDRLCRNSRMEQTKQVLKIICHLTISSVTKPDDKEYFLRNFLNAQILQNLLPKCEQSEVKPLLKIVVYLMGTPNGGKVLGQHMPFVGDIISRTVEVQECLAYTLRLCFELSGTKKHHKALLRSGVLNFCHSITSDLPKRTIQLFLGTVIRIGRKDNPPDVLKGLLKHELALRGFLSSLKVPSLEHLVNLALKIIDRLKKRMENDPDAFRTERRERQDSMEASSDSESDDRMPAPSAANRSHGATVISQPQNSRVSEYGLGSGFTYGSMMNSMMQPPSLADTSKLSKSQFSTSSFASYSSLTTIPFSVTNSTDSDRAGGGLLSPSGSEFDFSDGPAVSPMASMSSKEAFHHDKRSRLDTLEMTPGLPPSNRKSPSSSRKSSRARIGSTAVPPRIGGSIHGSPRVKPKAPPRKDSRKGAGVEQVRRASAAPPRQSINTSRIRVGSKPSPPPPKEKISFDNDDQQNKRAPIPPIQTKSVAIPFARSESPDAPAGPLTPKALPNKRRSTRATARKSTREMMKQLLDPTLETQNIGTHDLDSMMGSLDLEGTEYDLLNVDEIIWNGHDKEFEDLFEDEQNVDLTKSLQEHITQEKNLMTDLFSMLLENG